MRDIAEKAIDALNSLYHLPAIAVVALSCLVLGYVLRFVRKFPNDGIPLACWLSGGVLLPLLSSKAPGDSLRVWLAQNVLLGMVAGFAAWAAHKAVLSRVEDKIPWLGKALAEADSFGPAEPTKPAGAGGGPEPPQKGTQ